MVVFFRLSRRDVAISGRLRSKGRSRQHISELAPKSKKTSKHKATSTYTTSCYIVAITRNFFKYSQNRHLADPKHTHTFTFKVYKELLSIYVGTVKGTAKIMYWTTWSSGVVYSSSNRYKLSTKDREQINHLNELHLGCFRNVIPIYAQFYYRLWKTSYTLMAAVLPYLLTVKSVNTVVLICTYIFTFSKIHLKGHRLQK